MAGSIRHCVVDDDDWNYRGIDLLDNMGDAMEAVDEMMFVILSMRQSWPQVVDMYLDHYHQCSRGERPWPEFMKGVVR